MSGIPPEKIARYKHRRMGVGGIYVCIEHTPEPKRIVSCYMHLGGYNVAEREQVLAGQMIGELGRTGVKVSPPHLHFEVRVDDRLTNPLRTLGDYVIPPKETMTHQYVVRAKRAKIRACAPSRSRQRAWSRAPRTGVARNAAGEIRGIVLPPMIRRNDALDYHRVGRPGKIEVVPTKPLVTPARSVARLLARRRRAVPRDRRRTRSWPGSTPRAATWSR